MKDSIPGAKTSTVTTDVDACSMQTSWCSLLPFVVGAEQQRPSLRAGCAGLIGLAAGANHSHLVVIAITRPFETVGTVARGSLNTADMLISIVLRSDMRQKRRGLKSYVICSAAIVALDQWSISPGSCREGSA